MHILRYNK